MNCKIKNYVDVLFSDVPGTKKARELKEEILSNMSERFEDYISQGKTENQAYSLVISSMGDIDEMLESVMPNAEFVKRSEEYRNRNARNMAIGVAMYLIGIAILIGLSQLGTLSDRAEFDSYGVMAFLLISAAATALIIYTHMSTPPEFEDYDRQTRSRHRMYCARDSRNFRSIMSIYWSIIIFIYLGFSFLTGYWSMTWLIWVLAAIFSGIIKIIFEMRQSDD